MVVPLHVATAQLPEGNGTSFADLMAFIVTPCAVRTARDQLEWMTSETVQMVVNVVGGHRSQAGEGRGTEMFFGMTQFPPQSGLFVHLHRFRTSL
jgi:hypothetical protein